MSIIINSDLGPVICLYGEYNGVFVNDVNVISSSMVSYDLQSPFHLIWSYDTRQRVGTFMLAGVVTVTVTSNRVISQYLSTRRLYDSAPDSYRSVYFVCLRDQNGHYALGMKDNQDELHFPTWTDALRGVTYATANAFGTAYLDVVGSVVVYYFEGLSDAIQGSIIIPSHEPYDDIPISGPGGGDGTYLLQDSDPIDFPTVPTLAAVNTGFVSLWSPTEQQMLDLSSYMWNANPLTVDFWKKLVADPKDLIFGLSLVPLNLDDLGYIDGQGSVVVGLVNTGIVMDKVSSQWVQFDCGSIDIEEAWGAYLDYDPYTKLEIYLPFCGVHPIRVDDFTPGAISLKYYIDLLSGTCVAVIKSTKSDKHGDVLNSVVYQFMGNCAAQIPVTSQQFADAVRSAISIAASIGSMVAVGVGGAAAIGAAGSASAATAAGAHTLSRQLSTGASAVENVMNIKPAIERSGAIGSTAALLGVRTPYLILTRPRMARPDMQSTYTGYPSFITETLGDISGWTIVQAIHLDAIPCTAEEMSEIDELLKGGVIL